MQARLFLPAAAFGIVALLGQRTGAPGTGATLTLTYRAASEDESQAGQVRLVVRREGTGRAAIWEHECALGARADSDIPGEPADQYWSFRAQLIEPPAGEATLRLRYRLVTGRGAGAETERLLKTDGADALHLEALSARATCRYDRLYVTATAR